MNSIVTWLLSNNVIDLTQLSPGYEWPPDLFVALPSTEPVTTGVDGLYLPLTDSRVLLLLDIEGLGINDSPSLRVLLALVSQITDNMIFVTQSIDDSLFQVLGVLEHSRELLSTEPGAGGEAVQLRSPFLHLMLRSFAAQGVEESVNKGFVKNRLDESYPESRRTVGVVRPSENPPTCEQLRPFIEQTLQMTSRVLASPLCDLTSNRVYTVASYRAVLDEMFLSVSERLLDGSVAQGIVRSFSVTSVAHLRYTSESERILCSAKESVQAVCSGLTGLETDAMLSDKVQTDIVSPSVERMRAYMKGLHLPVDPDWEEVLRLKLSSMGLRNVVLSSRKVEMSTRDGKRIGGGLVGRRIKHVTYNDVCDVSLEYRVEGVWIVAGTKNDILLRTYEEEHKPTKFV